MFAKKTTNKLGCYHQTSDTETDAFEFGLLRQRTNSDRLQMSAVLTQGARQLCLCGLRQTHATLPETAFAQTISKAFLGENYPQGFSPTGNDMTWIQDSIAIAVHLHTIFEELNILYYITGGVASSTYGEPRTTRDLSEKQWRDVLGVLKVQGENLDFEYLNHQAEQLELTNIFAQAMTEAGV